MRTLRPTAVLALVALVALAACAAREDPQPCGLVDEPCSGDSACASGTTCTHVTWDFGDGALCTKECSSQLDCPSANGDSAHCLDVARDGRFRCYLGCRHSWNCPGSQVCQPLATGDAVCLP
jgi:hypothetical protein